MDAMPTLPRICAADQIQACVVVGGTKVRSFAMYVYWPMALATLDLVAIDMSTLMFHDMNLLY